jgi:hypothetical protein
MNEALQLLSELADHASIEDISSQLRQSGIASLEAVLTMLRSGIQTRIVEQNTAKALINIQALRNGVPNPNIVHQVPKIPFILNGVMYDPQDIVRFNGKELHFIPSANDDYMAVVDNRDVVANWMQNAYLSSVAGVDLRAAAQKYSHGGYNWGEGPGPRDYGPPPPGQPGGPSIVVGSGQTAGGRPGSWAHFFQDDWYQGDSFFLDAGLMYQDLTKVGRGMFGDWNDEISSIGFQNISFIALGSDIDFGGGLLFLWNGEPWRPSLNVYGWNDRVSSVMVIW